MNSICPRALFVSCAVLLAAMLACALGPKPAPLPEHVVECQFVPPEHVAESCLHGLSASLLELPDTTLFYEKDSILRINTPTGFEPYHAHLFHKVGDVHRMEQVVGPVDKQTGVLTISLSDFAQPEILVVTSADHRATPTAAAAPETAALGAAILPPYALSFKLVRKDQGAATLLSLQPFRYELESPHGNLHLLVTPANRGDMLLSLIDLDQKLSRAFKDAYFHFRPADAALAPRLTVEVATKEGKTWQRAGTWPVPPGALASTKGAEGADALLFALRTFRKDLIPFGPPAELALAYPKQAPEVTATVTGRMAGTREKAEYQLVVSHAVPDDRAAKSYAFKTQAVTLTHMEPEQSLSVDLSSVDSARFPVTAAVSHRLVTTWTTKGGLYAPVPPLGRTVLPSDAFDNGPSAPAHIICASSAAYFDLVNFRGDGGAAKLRLMRQLGPSGGTSPNTTPTDAGPDGSGWYGGTWNPGADPSSNPAGSNTAGGATGSTSGSSGPGGSNLNWTPELIPPPPNPPDPPEILVRLKCGCKYAVECKCPPHMWNMTDVMNRIMASKYVVDSAGKKYEVADYSWFGSHGASAPCHEKKQIGSVRISFWVGLNLVQRMFSVFVEFGPCMPAGGLGKKDKKDKEVKKDPGMPMPGPNDPQPKPVLPVLSISVAPDEGWDDARPVTEGDELVASADIVSGTPFNDPLLAGLIARRRDWSSVLRRGDIFLCSIVTLTEHAPRRVRSDISDIYDLQPERTRLFDSEWTRDPAKSWPTYDPSRTPGGRP